MHSCSESKLDNPGLFIEQEKKTGPSLRGRNALSSAGEGALSNVCMCVSVCVKARERRHSAFKHLRFIVSAGCYSVPSSKRHLMVLLFLLCTFSECLEITMSACLAFKI